MAASGGAPGASFAGNGGGSGTYVLRDLIKDVPLSSSDEDGSESHITCVDAWDVNLYIGTSAGEVLHYVSLPPDPADDSGQPSYIFASKLEPQYKHRQEGTDAGIKQILVLPDAGKACIICHGTLNFYTLPELSPAFGGQIQQSGCSWVGGLDANLLDAPESAGGDSIIVICLKQKLRLIRVPDARSAARGPTRVRDVELGAIAAIQRRGDLACVADLRMYSLLDVVNQRKNDLFPISSLLQPSPQPSPQAPSAADAARSPNPRSPAPRSPVRQPRSHERVVSLAGSIGPQTPDRGRLGEDRGSPFPPRSSSRQLQSPAQPSSREGSPTKPVETPSRPTAETDASAMPAASESPAVELLPPHIVSPTPNEFLLTTGTKLADPGVGMFVNMDGDPTRGTLEFSSYPESLVLDGSGVSDVPSSPGRSDSEGFVLAIVRRQTAEGVQKAIEIQRWDADPGEALSTKEWLLVGSPGQMTKPCGLRIASTPGELSVPEISLNLRQRKVSIRVQATPADEAEAKRNLEEDRFAARFAQVTGNVLFYSDQTVSWVTRSAFITQLEHRLSLAVRQIGDGAPVIDVPAVQQVINSIRGQEPRDELEFMTLTYVRQKASLLLFGNLLLQTANNFASYERDKRFSEEALVAGDIDPRIILSLVPPFADEVVQGEGGIWIAQGLRDTVEMLRSNIDADQIVRAAEGAYGQNLLKTVKSYLFVWRQKKGLASVADEANIFRSVDAALVHILLLLDQDTPRGPAAAGSVRAELNDVVDHGVECFDRAVELFQSFSRLYMLSRLYQSRKMVALVLSTWRRILEGEHDAGGELVDGEHVVRRYLSKIRDQDLVQEYGSWLANRNPKLGVQVFADDSSRVKFEPTNAVRILREKAPAAVKDYLEHLVFGKNHAQYVNELIAYYLETVLSELDSSEGAKEALRESYRTYRALRPPKTTYRYFMEDNANETEWQQNRLRLLQLIGGSHGAASEYDAHALRQRLEAYSDELVPEMIILNGREAKHEEALRLIIHGLGDFDTAIRYCLLGGSSIFHPGSGPGAEQPLPSQEEQAKLFERLLHEFLRIEDVSERLERTSELLDRFGGWFDIADVLELIPDDWSVDLVSGFLVHALRRLVQERNQTGIVKALSSVQNLKRSVEVIEKMEALGPTIVTEEAGETDVS